MSLCEPLIAATSENHKSRKIVYRSKENWPIGVGLSWYSLDAIDCANSYFSGTVNLKFDWYDPEYLKVAKPDFDETKCEKPELSIVGGKDLNVLKDAMELTDEGIGHVQYNLRVAGNYKEEFELHHFPFDVQALHLRIRSLKPLDKGSFVYS